MFGRTQTAKAGGVENGELESKPSPPLQPASSPRSQRRWTLPAWLDHFNARDLKILLRCSLAAWVAMILTFIHPALADIGQATFFAALALFIVPPASIVFIYLLAAISLLLGMCVAWAWCLLVMKAALAARPSSETASRVRLLQQQAVERAKATGQSVQWEAQILVHDGFMLDARVTIVFYVLICLFIYALARLRCANPKFTLAQIFGTITSAIFLLYGPTLPSFNASLGSLLTKPAAIGIGVGTACCLLLFPQSTSAVVLDSMANLVLLMKTPFETTRKRLAEEPEPLEKLKAFKGRMIGLYKAMEPALGFLPLDFSRARWNAADIKSLQDPLREAVISSISLLDVHISWVTAVRRESDYAAHKNDWDSLQNTMDKNEHHPAGRREVQQTALLMDALKRPEEGTIHANLLETMRRTTDDILILCSESLDLASRCISAVNGCRWFAKPSAERFDRLTQDLETSLSKLHTTRAECAANVTEGIIEIYADIFDEDGELKSVDILGPPSMRGIILAMVIEERILVAATSTERLLARLSSLMKLRAKPQICAPSGLRHAVSWLFNAKLSVSVDGTPDDPAEDPDIFKDSVTLKDEAQEAYRRLRASRGYAAATGRRTAFARALIGTYKWLFDPAGMFALRMVIVTIVTAIPASLSNSAGFYYREKGLWVVITAQTSVLVYMADFTFSLVIRILATVIGGVLAMLAWYMGSGSGPGNPYGMSASTAVMIVVIVWLRLYLPPVYTKAAILGGATFGLVVGFSYDANHIRQYGLPGIGYEAFWKRVVAVLAGYAAATIVQILPKPPSATRHVCRSLSSTVSTLSDHYALLLSHWGRRAQHSPLGAVAEEVSLDVAEALESLNEMISLLKYEFTTGPFTKDILCQTQDLCHAMNECLRRLLSLTSTLPDHLQDRLSRVFGILDDRTVGGVMAVLGIIEQSLLTGLPLPERLPTPLVRRFYETWQDQHHGIVLNKALVRDEDYRRYCVAMSSYLKFLSVIDDTVVMLKRALGERHIVDNWDPV